MDDEARAKKLMQADLGLEHRDAVSAPLEGMSANAAAQYEAQVQAENQARRERILRGAPGVDQKLHITLSKWNTPQSFGGDDAAEDLQNRYDGQGHRHQLSQRVGQKSDRSRDFQENRLREGQHRGRPQPSSAQRLPLGRTNANANHQPALSPRAHGTIKFGPTRHAVTLTSASMPQHNGIPNVGTHLAAAVQATSPAANLSARTPAALSSTTAVTPAPRAAPVSLAASPLQRPASPALSAASSSSNSAVAMAQAAMKARFEAMQKEKAATPAPSPIVEASSTSNTSAHVSSQAVEAPITNESTEDASTEVSGDFHSEWPVFGRTAGASSNRKSPAVADAQATIRDRIDSQYNCHTTRAVLTTAAQIPTLTGTTTPHLINRPCVTGTVNGAATHVPTLSTTYNTVLAPRGRATFTVSNPTATNCVHADASAADSDVANGLLSLPNPTTKQTSSTVPSAARSLVVQAGNGSAAITRVPEEAVINKAKIHARRPPQFLDDVEKFYGEHPECRPAFDQARQRLVRKVVQLAAAGDMVAAKDNGKHLNPSADWLIEAAFAAWSGASPDHDDHPTIKEIVTAIKAKKEQLQKAAEVKEQAPIAKQSVATPAAQPVSSNASGSTNSSAEADSISTAVSTPTPPRTVMGMLTATFFSAAGRFLANKEFPLSEPITVHVAVTTKADDFDPLKLADDMEVLATKYSNPAAAV